MGYGDMMVKETHQVAAITLRAWDFVCQTLDCSGLQMALYLSKDMATRLNVETLTETPIYIKKNKEKGHSLVLKVMLCSYGLSSLSYAYKNLKIANYL